MQTYARLGSSLGQALAAGFDQSAKQRGVLDGMRANELTSQIELQDAQRGKYGAEADLLRRQLELGDDNNLARTALLAMGIDGDTAAADYGKYSKAGHYEPETVPLAFTNGGEAKPTPEYVAKFPDVSRALASLRTALATGDKNLDLPKALQQIQRNNISAGLTADNAPRVALELSALDGKDPTNITEAALTQQIADGGNYGTLAKALLAAKGKGVFDSFNGGTLNVLDGTEHLNDIGNSMVRENNASANQSNAGAKENIAQADLAGVRAKNIREGKGDGSQVKEKDFARIRDDIRADYNAQFPFNTIDGNRGKDAPSFQDFTKQWLRQYNIDENEFFRNTNPTAQPQQPASKAQPSKEYQEYVDAWKKEKDPERRRRMTEFARSKGLVK